MRVFSAFFLLVAATGATASAVFKPNEVPSSNEAIGVSQELYDNLAFYFKYAANAYAITCPKPLGNHLVLKFNHLLTDTQGYIARDDTRKEIIVAFRGSTSPRDFLTDASITLIPFTSRGVNAPVDVRVHSGFLRGWNSLATKILSTVEFELAAHPGYTIVTSGHSLGGALSSVAGIALKENFPNIPLRLYTYGQPRTGNRAYARFVNERVGVSNIFRGVHTRDDVPTMVPTAFGYAHHATEYWSTSDPSTAATTRQCNTSGEDPTCSASIFSGGINPPHLLYYNILSTSKFCT